MLTVLPLSKLSDDEKSIVGRLASKARREDRRLKVLESYRDAEQKLVHIGMALPPELRMFETVINVPGMAVRETAGRQELRTFQRTDRPFVGGETEAQRDERVAADTALQEAWEYNNLASQSIVTHMNARTFGRTFATVGTNDEDPDYPLIKNESPVGMGFDVDVRSNQIAAAFRQYKVGAERRGTLYLRAATLHLTSTKGGWMVEDRDDHNLGVVPIVMFVNQPWAGGRSEMADVMGKTDAIARMITNMQVAGETLALPHRWAAGIDPNEFVDEDGNPLAIWDAYMTMLRATASKDAKFGQWDSADLDNFNKAVNNMLAWCAAELGLPTRYAGQQSVNPAAEGAIIADEIRLIKRVELMNKFDGDAWAWVMELSEWLRTGTRPRRNSIRALWYNPATPTYSQRAEAVFKMTTGPRPILSREGAWDELGWGEERKARERSYLLAEANDPEMQLAARLLNGDAG